MSRAATGCLIAVAVTKSTLSVIGIAGDRTGQVVAAGNPTIMAADTGLGWKGLWIEEDAQSRANERADGTIRSCWLYGPLSVSVRSGHSVVPTLPIKRRLGGKAGYVHQIHLLSKHISISTIVVG